MHLPSFLSAGLAILSASFALFAATPAVAEDYVCGSSAPYLANYDFAQTYEVYAIAKYTEFGACGSGISNSDTAPAGASTLTDIFPKTDPITRAILLGVASDLPGDPTGQQHLVVFTNTAFAASAQGIAFGTLFPTSNEAQLIAALLSMANGTGIDSDYDLLSNFASGVALTGPNGDAGFGLGDTFAAIAFSNGQTIGTGLLYATPAPTNAVPEPATWATMMLGFGMIGLALRRRPVRRVRFAV